MNRSPVMGKGRRTLPKTRGDRMGDRHRLEIPKLIMRKSGYFLKSSFNTLHDIGIAIRKERTGTSVVRILRGSMDLRSPSVLRFLRAGKDYPNG